MNNLNEFELTLSNKTKVIFCIIKKVLTSLPGRSCPGRSLAPRLCHLARTEMGYVHPLPGPGSPADHAGLRPQDRLVEVNGVNIEGMRHAEVVAFIKKGGDETWLLVVDPDTDDHFKRRGVVPSVNYDGPSISNGSPNPQMNGSSTTQSMRSTRSDLSSQGNSTQEGNRLLDPFAEMGLSLSATAAEEKMKVHSKEKRKAPQMDWMKKYELFSNF
uniref:NHERF family PDZ scaffold protein 2 n=1 Tax=Labrus bergylta TaxID=56723 RepID=A0A3Q3E6W3_9LABR